jgi:hypothetical protein
MFSEAERAQLVQQDTVLLPMPLRAGGNPQIMGAHLRQVVRLLKRDGASPCRDAVTYLTGLFERSAPLPDGIACRKACSHCCVQTVVVTAAEAFAVAAEMRDRQETVAKLLAAAPRHLGEPKSEWRDCIFLGDDGACTVYEARPLACHAFVSFDLQACIQFFAGKDVNTQFTPSDRQQMLYVCRMMLSAAHRLIGHGDQPGYELSGAVTAILKTPDAEARWLAGENILKDVPQGPPIPPAFADEIGRMAAYVAPML